MLKMASQELSPTKGGSGTKRVFTMDDNLDSTKMKGLPAGWLILGATCGVVAAMLVWRRAKSGPNPWDVDSVLNACDKAASKLEGLLHQESHARQMG